jgi:AAA+ ATPase superfamily predicted ATPase
VFIDRQAELSFLDSILERRHPTAVQLILLYGRRRVGKTTLLRHWAECTDVSYTYWAAEREPAALQRRKLFARVLGVEVASAPAFDSWADCWQAIASVLADRRHVLLLDEFTYAVASDAGMLSSLQHAWDQLFQGSRVVLILCGSHVHTMQALQAQQSPLFGRLTAQWWLRPLPFAALSKFFPYWSAEERVTAWTIVGGVPAYLEWLDPDLSPIDNVSEVILAPGSMFIAEPIFLLYDEVREASTHLAIFKAIGAGNHALSEISNAALVGRTHLPAYLARLRELRLVERRLPITVPPAQRQDARSGRYHLSDPYFRFYFRFIAPYHDELSYRPERVLDRIDEGLCAFVGATAFEELSRQWLAERGRAGQLPFEIQEVGSHWSRQSDPVQVNVVGINWAEKAILLGECKWGTGAVGRDVVRELIEVKTPRVLKALPGEEAGWRVHYAFFARTGFTDAAQQEAAAHSFLLIDLADLDRCLNYDVDP